MNHKNIAKTTIKNTAKELAQLAVFVALVIAAQFALSFIPGVEVVTLLFVSYAFVFGVRRGMLAATAFSLLRQLLFGFFPNILVLYLLYYNALTALFGFLGKRVGKPLKNLWWIILLACLCTACFTMLDNILTPLWFRYTQKAARAHFIASLPVMFPQIVCTAVTVGGLFFPLYKAFQLIKRKTP
jgi:hypothetical protein